MDEAEKEGRRQERGDYFVYLVLASLPWVGHTLYSMRKDDLLDLLTRIAAYMDHRDSSHFKGVAIFQSESVRDVCLCSLCHPSDFCLLQSESYDHLAHVWACIRNLRQRDFSMVATLTPFTKRLNELQQLQACKLPRLNIPPDVCMMC